jgi:hypothetical protein
MLHCQSDQTLAIIYFYFDFNDSKKQRYENLIRSMITQLSMQSTNTPEALNTIYCRCQEGRQQPTIADLVLTFQYMLRDFHQAFIILDALDECTERKELLQLIKNIVSWKLEKLHILTTSRRENDIEKWLEPLVNNQEKICIESALVNEDIHTYVHERLQTDRSLQMWQNKPEAQQEIKRTLLDKADGM